MIINYKRYKNKNNYTKNENRSDQKKKKRIIIKALLSQLLNLRVNYLNYLKCRNNWSSFHHKRSLKLLAAIGGENRAHITYYRRKMQNEIVNVLSAQLSIRD